MLSAIQNVWRRQHTDLILARILNTRITLFFFFITLAAFATQVTIQALMFDVDSSKLNTVTSFANLPQGLFVSVEKNFVVKACNQSDIAAPRLDGSLNCPTIFATGDSSNVPILASASSTVHGLCDEVLLWPFEIFMNEVRTDVAFIAMETWLLLVSVVALSSESVPHLIASVIIRSLSTVWSFWDIFETQRHHNAFEAVVTRGACIQFSRDPGFLGQLPSLFTRRLNLDIACFVLNFIALGALSYLALQIYKRFQKQHLDTVGASDHLQSVHKYVLWLSASFQISAFVLLTAIALWINQLQTPLYRIFSKHLQAYEGIFISTLVILFPWLISGHYAVRKEIKWLMIAFLGVSAMMMIAWTFMFLSTIYRVTFVTWSFFAAMTLFAIFLNLMTLIVGVICRRNFDKGLVHFLHVRKVLANSDFPAENFDNQNPTVKSFLQTPDPIKVNLGDGIAGGKGYGNGPYGFGHNGKMDDEYEFRSWATKGDTNQVLRIENQKKGDGFP